MVLNIESSLAQLYHGCDRGTVSDALSGVVSIITRRHMREESVKSEYAETIRT